MKRFFWVLVLLCFSLVGHVFAEDVVLSPEEVQQRWDEWNEYQAKKSELQTRKAELDKQWAPYEQEEEEIFEQLHEDGWSGGDPRTQKPYADFLERNKELRLERAGVTNELTKLNVTYIGEPPEAGKMYEVSLTGYKYEYLEQEDGSLKKVTLKKTSDGNYLNSDEIAQTPVFSVDGREYHHLGSEPFDPDQYAEDLYQRNSAQLEKLQGYEGKGVMDKPYPIVEENGKISGYKSSAELKTGDYVEGVGEVMVTTDADGNRVIEAKKPEVKLEEEGTLASEMGTKVRHEGAVESSTATAEGNQTASSVKSPVIATTGTTSTAGGATSGNVSQDVASRAEKTTGYSLDQALGEAMTDFKQVKTKDAKGNDYVAPEKVQTLQHPAHLVGAGDDSLFGGAGDITRFLQNIAAGLTAVVTTVAILFIVNNAFNMVNSAGNADKITKVKKAFNWIFLGMLLIIFSYVLVKTLISLPYAGQMLSEPVANPAQQ